MEVENEVAERASLPSSLEELLAAVADYDSVFGLVDDPARELRTPAYKAYMATGGCDARLDKTKALPTGFHMLQVRAHLPYHPSTLAIHLC